MLINIPVSVNKLESGAGAARQQTANWRQPDQHTDFGGPGWGGPCPPVGHKPHHYNFTRIESGEAGTAGKLTASSLGFMINANSIGKTTLTGMYGR